MKTGEDFSPVEEPTGWRRDGFGGGSSRGYLSLIAAFLDEARHQMQVARVEGSNRWCHLCGQATPILLYEVHWYGRG